MNTADLHDLLAERAEIASPTAPTTDARLAGALGKARAIRRRRRAAVGVAVAAAVGVLGAVALPAVITADSPDPARPAEPLLTYAHGGVLIGERTFDLPERSASVTVTPEEFPLTLATYCDTGSDTALRVEIRFDDGAGSRNSCGGESVPDVLGTLEAGMPGDEPQIELGEPVTFTVTVTGSHRGFDDSLEVPIPDTGNVAFGIYQAVPWDEYEFPPQPDQLINLDEWLQGKPHPSKQLVKSAADPNAPHTVEVAGDDFTLKIKSQTPGIMRIFVNDVEIGMAEFWDYAGVVYYLGSVGANYNADSSWLLPDEPVRIELVPEQFTGEWRAYLIECRVDGDKPGDGPDEGATRGCPAPQEEAR